MRQSDCGTRTGHHYANDPRLIGEQFAMPAETTDALRAGHRGSQSAGEPLPRPGANWVQVSLPLVSEDGCATSFRSASEQDTLATRCPQWVWMARPCWPVRWLLAAPLGLLAIRMARRISDELRTREAVAQCDGRLELERRRIAADPHDGTVQQLAGVSYALQEWLRERTLPVMRTPRSASGRRRASRTSVRELRTLLVVIITRPT